MIFTLLFAATSAAPSVTVEALVDGLHLEALGELRMGVDVAVGAEPDATGWVGSIEAALLARGFRAFALEGTDAELIAAGAEWRLELETDGHKLGATLIEIDPGLFEAWRPTVARASAVVALDAVPIDPPTTIKPRLGPLSQIGALPDRILALEACGAPAAELLLVLTLDHLYAYTVDRRRLDLWAELSLGVLPPAKMPTRDPIGAVVCGEAGQGGITIGFGHGRAGGGWARLDLKAPGKKRIQWQGALPGVPLARMGGRWLYARTDQGRNRWIGARWDDGPELEPKPFYSVTGIRDDRGVATELVAIDPAYHLAFLDSKLGGNASTERSGAALAARRIGAERVVLTTDASKDGERFGLLGGPTRMPIDAAVMASALLRLDADNWIAIVAADRAQKGTTVHAAELRLGDGP